MRVDDPNDNGAGAFDPAIAVTESGIIYVAWEDWRTNHPSIFFAASFDSGQSFVYHRKINEGDFTALDPTICADDSGRVYIAWIDNRKPQFPLYFSRSSDSWKTFFINQRIDAGADSGATDPSLACNSSGLVGIAWCKVWVDSLTATLKFAQSTDYGQHFSTIRRVDDDPTPQPYSLGRPSLVLNRQRFHVAWDQHRDGYDPFNNIYFTHC